MKAAIEGIAAASIRRVAGFCAAVLCALVMAALAPPAGADGVSTKSALTVTVKIDPSQISVSGVSSGAYMAVQMHVAHSKTFMGVAAVAGGPYFCAGNLKDINLVKAKCMYGAIPTTYLPFTDAAMSLSGTKEIDDVSNLAKDRVYIFNSSEDQVIAPALGLLSNQFYLNFVDDADQVKAWAYLDGFGPLYPVAHGMPTMMTVYEGFENLSVAVDGSTPCSPTNSQTYPWFPNPFMRGNDPWIYHCYVPSGADGYDLAAEFLAHIYATVTVKAVKPQGMLLTLKQLPFVHDAAISSVAGLHAHGIGENAYLYAPSKCLSGATCKLHVAFHGCQQFPEWQFKGKIGSEHDGETVTFGDLFYNGAYNGVAEAANIVVLYPQAYNIGTEQSDINPYGCWEFWAFFEQDYYNFYTQAGRQITMVKNMVDHVVAGKIPAAGVAPLRR